MISGIGFLGAGAILQVWIQCERPDHRHFTLDDGNCGYGCRRRVLPGGCGHNGDYAAGPGLLNVIEIRFVRTSVAGSSLFRRIYRKGVVKEIRKKGQ